MKQTVKRLLEVQKFSIWITSDLYKVNTEKTRMGKQKGVIERF